LSEVELSAIPGAVVRSWDELVAEGRRAIDGFQWKLGDLAGEVETSYGEASLAAYAAEINVNYTTLSEYRRIANLYEIPRRLGISWGAAQALAAQPDRLELIASRKWTVAQARELAASRRAPSPLPSGGQPSLSPPLPLPLPTAPEPDESGESLGWPEPSSGGSADSRGAPLLPPLRDELPPAQPHVGHNSGDNEWYTPADYIKAAKAVMGDIDLDPASSDVANSVVGAYKFYTEADNGLSKRWSGRVWMNPPYAQPLIAQFAERLAESFAAGDVTEACVLVNNATETAWCSALITPASAICFPRGRIKFWHPRKESAPLQGQLIIYLGPRPADFRAEFRQFGPVKGEF